MSQSKQYEIVISGGGSGIGAALAEALSSDGHLIIICGRRKEKLQDVAEKYGNVKAFACDVSKEKEVIALRNFVTQQMNNVDVLINAAGLFGAIGRFDKTDSWLWKQTLDINLFGTYLMSKYFLPLILNSERKRIINFSGGGAFGTFPNYSAYAVSKAAVVRMTENFANELEGTGVHVNCVAPGFVATEIHNATLIAGESLSGTDHYQLTQKKLKDGAVPMETPVNCVNFLISHDSDGLTGKTISASFDKWSTEAFKKAIPEISKSSLYTMRRMDLTNLQLKDPLREKLNIPN